MMDHIIVAKISLHYETRPTGIYEDVTREKYAQMIRERKERRADMNYYYKRITERQAEEIRYENFRLEARREYDKRIQEKYNVGPDWRNSRWFIEQVRPTI